MCVCVEGGVGEAGCVCACVCIFVCICVAVLGIPVDVCVCVHVTLCVCVSLCYSERVEGKLYAGNVTRWSGGEKRKTPITEWGCVEIGRAHV